MDCRNTFRPYKVSRGSRVKPSFKPTNKGYLRTLLNWKGLNTECPVCNKPIDKHLCAATPINGKIVRTCLNGDCFTTYSGWIADLVKNTDIKPYA